MTMHRVDEYLDGLLADDAQAAFLDHLAACAACQDALHADVQVRDREDALRAVAAAGPVPAPVVSIARARRRRAPAAIVGVVALAAAAAAVVVLARPARRAAPAAPTLALAPSRVLEIRLAWGPAAGFRPYDPMRSDRAVGEYVDPRAIAALVERDDCAGVAAAYVLSGELVRAEQQHQRCGDGADLDADRAGRAVLAGAPERALELADRALALAPAHPVAHWNRALALRDLGLGLAAAAAFERVAAVDQPWAEEARRRADAARAPLLGAKARWQDVFARGTAMIPAGPLLASDLAIAVPGRARLRFHDAVRTAGSRDRLEALRPLARALEGRAGVGLERYIDAAARGFGPARAALAPGYAEVLARQSAIDPPAFSRLVAAARAARADDVLLGAHYLARGADPTTQALAAVTDDSWFIGLTAVDRAAAATTADAAATELATLDRLCAAGAPGYVCMQRSLVRAQLAVAAFQPAPAMPAAREAMAAATAQGEFPYRVKATLWAGEAARLRGDHGLARGYFEEYALAADDCRERHYASSAMLAMAVERGQRALITQVLATRPRCDGPPDWVFLIARSDLIAAGVADDRAAFAADLATARAAPASTASDDLVADFLTARLALADDPAAGTRLAKVAAAARARGATDVRARLVEAAAWNSVIVDAGRRGAWAASMAAAAAARGVATPTRCALALASDDFQFVGVGVAADGTADGMYQREGERPRDWTVPDRLARMFTGCPEIAVLAAPPWLGVGPLLPPGQSWHFVMGEPVDGPPPLTRAVVVASPEPPAALGLPRLAAVASPPGARSLVGVAATVAAVAEAARDATLLEVHAHATTVPGSDAPVIALSGDRDWALTAEAVAGWRLDGHPVVLLADCAGGVPARFNHVAWGLPAALHAAGARAVVAALTDIPDAGAAAFFAEVREGLRADPDVGRVVARLRAEKIRVEPTSWVRNVVVFR